MTRTKVDWADKKAEELICQSRNWNQADRMTQMADALRNAERWRVAVEGGILILHGKRLCAVCSEPLEQGEPICFTKRKWWQFWLFTDMIHANCIQH